jgi:hypothetical protein
MGEIRIVNRAAARWRENVESEEEERERGGRDIQEIESHQIN